MAQNHGEFQAGAWTKKKNKHTFHHVLDDFSNRAHTLVQLRELKDYQNRARNVVPRCHGRREVRHVHIDKKLREHGDEEECGKVRYLGGERENKNIT